MWRVIYDGKNRIMEYFRKDVHNGIDIGWKGNLNNAQNFDIYANCDGIVESIQTGIPNDKNSTGARTWGNFVLIRHANGMKSRYAHLSQVLVKKGQSVSRNTKIGIMGESGKAYGRHLHFEVYKNGERINPYDYLTKAICESVPKPTPTPKPQPATVFVLGERVLVCGYGYASSRGDLPRTATYNGNKNDPSDFLYITKIAKGASYPYHLSRGKTLHDHDRGWFSEDELRKI